MKYTTTLIATLISLLATTEAFAPSQGCREDFARKVIDLRDRALLRTKAKPADPYAAPSPPEFKIVPLDHVIRKTITSISWGNPDEASKKIAEMRRRTSTTTMSSAIRVRSQKIDKAMSPLYQVAPTKSATCM